MARGVIFFLNIGPSFFFSPNDSARKTRFKATSLWRWKKTTFAINASICPIFLFRVYRARHTTRIHTRTRKKKSGGRTWFPSALTSLAKESSCDSTGTWRVKDTAKRITVEYHVRNRAIASTRFEIFFSNASIDRETAPLSPKLPCLPRWITSFGRSCILKELRKKRKKNPIAPEKSLPPLLSKLISVLKIKIV